LAILLFSDSGIAGARQIDLACVIWALLLGAGLLNMLMMAV
jgi:hypothetical protein